MMLREGYATGGYLAVDVVPILDGLRSSHRVGS
jgi:hypothetical protein